MYIPMIGEKVELAERNEVFLVLAVDLGTRTVELVPLTDAVYTLEASFSVLRPFRAEVEI